MCCHCGFNFRFSFSDSTNDDNRTRVEEVSSLSLRMGFSRNQKGLSSKLTVKRTNVFWVDQQTLCMNAAKPFYINSSANTF